MLKPLLIAAAIAAALTQAAYAQSYGAMDAPASQARTALAVKTGTVIDIQDVNIDIAANPNTNIFGGVIGATAGAVIGRDSGWAGQALAGTVGAALGAKAAERLSAERRSAQQVIVQLDQQGDAIAVIQEPGATPLAVGQKVYLVGAGNNLRAVPARQP
jgi:outer membrane lipoprotein SlyB